jgi:hypothetical protein
MPKKKTETPPREVHVKRTATGLEEVPNAKPITDDGWLARQLRGEKLEPGDFDENETPKKKRHLRAVK